METRKDEDWSAIKKSSRLSTFVVMFCRKIKIMITQPVESDEYRILLEVYERLKSVIKTKNKW